MRPASGASATTQRLAVWSALILSMSHRGGQIFMYEHNCSFFERGAFRQVLSMCIDAEDVTAVQEVKHRSIDKRDVAGTRRSERYGSL